MQPHVFDRIYGELLNKTPDNVQVYALTWAAPYRVGCMSITMAFAAGYDQSFCASGCKPIRKSPYFGSSSRHPHSDYSLRPAMMLAGLYQRAVEVLIDRGVRADNTRPRGTGYLVTTSDEARSVRARMYPAVISKLSPAVKLEAVNADFLEQKTDILFYLTGLANVPKITANRFLPGAIADHLTSTGGQLTDSSQMSALRWLEAGATGSYGTVVEPCNLIEKFPHPGILISRYLAGETLIEAYWKSVAMPGSGCLYW